MTLAYLPRLVCVVLACFFLAGTALSLLVAVAARPAIRFAERFAPAAAATLMLALRLAPFAAALLLALCLCMPSYLWFEPDRVDERVGPACLLLAAAGALTLLLALTRATRAAARSSLFLRRCRQSADAQADLLIVESSQPFLALAGIAQPRIVISRRIADELSPDELSVVLSHERAHHSAHDNLKRLCAALSPGFRPLERAWVRFAEYAADEAAVSNDPARAVALASALVRVARFGQTPVAAIAFLGDSRDLPARVERLLAPQPAPRPKLRLRTLPAALAALCAAALALNPLTLRFVQEALETLVQ